MRSLKIAVAALITFSLSFASVAARAQDSTATISGVTFTWPETIYEPTLLGNVSVTWSVKNNSGRKVSSAQLQIVDKFGELKVWNLITGLNDGEVGTNTG